MKSLKLFHRPSPGATFFEVGTNHQSGIRQSVDVFIAPHGIAHVEAGGGVVW
jgi:hypothetical protein